MKTSKIEALHNLYSAILLKMQTSNNPSSDNKFLKELKNNYNFINPKLVHYLSIYIANNLDNLNDAEIIFDKNTNTFIIITNNNNTITGEIISSNNDTMLEIRRDTIKKNKEETKKETTFITEDGIEFVKICINEQNKTNKKTYCEIFYREYPDLGLINHSYKSNQTVKNNSYMASYLNPLTLDKDKLYHIQESQKKDTENLFWKKYIKNSDHIFLPTFTKKYFHDVYSEYQQYKKNKENNPSSLFHISKELLEKKTGLADLYHKYKKQINAETNYDDTSIKNVEIKQTKNKSKKH